MKDLKLNFDNLTKRDEATTKFTRLYQRSGQKAFEFVNKARELNLVADFSTNQVWEYMWSGLREEIRDYMIRERISKGKWDPSKTLQACYTIIHDAGLKVEECASGKILAQKHKEALVALDKGKGGLGNSAADTGKGSKSSKFLILVKYSFTNNELDKRSSSAKRTHSSSNNSRKSRQSSTGGISKPQN